MLLLLGEVGLVHVLKTKVSRVVARVGHVISAVHSEANIHIRQQGPETVLKLEN